ncbi:o-succinylbenzoate synthase [Cyclobacterium jeungdonense]|uniref:O-succinylbenzoate synthase n=1 Tax=Cyclobacterium jeungdonense TaxID=708087 RepID=A0ABT8C9B4_9BACT|nr:o-succinylbenzoate synthase [Cyclobacterium jeungdonense]MDN3688619.1 o-succinylbenzoate synthase [Cyclobacterium jeungdonense]
MAQTFKIKAAIKPYSLDFTFDAGTSRGVLTEKQTHFIQVQSPVFPDIYGIGEAGPLKGLSPDDLPDFLDRANEVLNKLEKISFSKDPTTILTMLSEVGLDEYPSLRFGLETALLDLVNGGTRKILPNSFYEHGSAIPINGLIWMGEKRFMKAQIDQKLQEGFECIKMKIGAIDFEMELALLESIRKKYSKEVISLRVDANGAFDPNEAMVRMERLAKLEIHSIEQPIHPGNRHAMAQLCRTSPIPIALDEELIGINDFRQKKALLEDLKPAYLILKPTLVGGILATQEWIRLAEDMGIGWWMTSALESNIGLNAIAQLTSSLNPILPQGLGTGMLYRNNVSSPLVISSGKLRYDKDRFWSIPDWNLDD